MPEAGGNLSNGFRLAHWEVRPRHGTILYGDTTQHVEPRVMDVLACLARHAGDVVTRDEFIREVWNGRVVTDEVLSRCISQIRGHLGDEPRAARFVATVPKVGYKLLVPAIPLPQQPDTSTGAVPDAIERPPAGSTVAREARRHGWLAVPIALLVVGTALFISWPRSGAPPVAATTGSAATSATDRVSVAVLPFRADPALASDATLADGLTDQLVETLGHIHGLRVVGRTSSFYFRDRDTSPVQVSRTLHVAHVLIGSLDATQPEIRVTAHLIDGATGRTEWSHSFKRADADYQSLRADVVRAVAGALRVRLLEDDELRLAMRPTTDAEAYSLYLEARARADSGEATDLLQAKRQLEDAVRRDPKFAAAYADLATVIAELVALVDLPGGDGQGRAAAERAMALDPNLSAAYLARGEFLGSAYWTRGDASAHELALADYRRALELDPGNAWAYTVYGYEVYLEDPQLALHLYQRSLALDPLQRDSQVQQAVVLRWLGRYDEARGIVQRMLSFYGDYRRGDQVAAQLERFAGHLDLALPSMQRIAAAEGGTYRLNQFYVWAMALDLNDELTAEQALDRLHGDPYAEAIAAAARAGMARDYGREFALLDRARRDDATGRLAIVAAHAALRAGLPDRTVAILAERFPWLADGRDAINGFNVASALDLAAALQRVGRGGDARRLLARTTTFLDGPDAPGGPPAMYLRAVAHALTGDGPHALELLERARNSGLRTLWGVTLVPLVEMPFSIVDDPRLAGIQHDARYAACIDGIRRDNAMMLARLRGRPAKQSTA